MLMAKLNRNRKVEEYEEEEYENYDGDEQEEDDGESMFDNPLVKYGAIGGVFVLIIIIALIFRMMSSPAPEQKTTEVPTTTEVSKVDVPKESEEPKIPTKGKDEQSATQSLERPESPLSGSESKEIGSKVGEAIDKIKDKADAVNTQDTGLFLTESGIFNVVKQLLSMGYKVDTDSIKGYKSNNDNVQQFTIQFTKEGVSPVTFTGNWAPAIGQIGLVQIHGDIPNAGSPTGGPQVDEEDVKNDTDKPEDWK